MMQSQTQRAAEVQRAQAEAARALQQSQQAANDARELANALRNQPAGPPTPPSPPGDVPNTFPAAPPPNVIVSGADGGVAVIAEPGATRIVVNGKSYLLDRAAGGDAITIEQAREEFGESGAVEILQNVLPIVGVIFGCVTAWLLFDSISKFFTKRADRRQAMEIAKLQVSAQGDRFDRIESAIEAMAVEVERITEAQRFQTRLLTERAESLPLPAAVAAGAERAPVSR